MERVIVNTAVIAGMAVGYIAYCKITKIKIRWYMLQGVAVGHIIGQTLVAMLEKSLQ